MANGLRRGALTTGEPEAAPPSRLPAGLQKRPDLGNWGAIE